MKYYAERNGLLGKECKIDFEELKQYFSTIYQYFDAKKCFEAATKGIWIIPPYQDEYQQKISPLFAPGPDIFFMNNLNSSQIYPIFDNCLDYTKEELFTVIEILYDNISRYDYKKNVLETNTVKKEFAMHINNVLKLYDVGYYLEPTSGTVTTGAIEPVKSMLSEDLSKILPEEVMTKTRSAIKMYYRFDSDMEMKKKAINILADILEPLRKDLQIILNNEYGISKNKHDKLIFGIVNDFNIRHNDSTQNKEYEHEIWYDWMIQYYSSVIITYYKLKLTSIKAENN